MISRQASKVCCKDRLWEIENFETAVFSPYHWHLHHKMGAYCNRSKDKLVEMGLYYNRPPNELIFLRNSDHMRIHAECRSNPVLRENLRRIEIRRCYNNGHPIENWLLDGEESRLLQIETEHFYNKLKVEQEE